MTHASVHVRAGRGSAEVHANSIRPISSQQLDQLRSETAITLNEAREVALRLLPTDRKEPFRRDTLKHWISRGMLTANGARVHLEAYKIGRKWVTTREALARFVDSLKG